MKQCNKCEVVKDITEFHKRKDTPDGRRYTCKECHNAHYRAKFLEDPEAKRSRNRRHYRNNRGYYNAKTAKRWAAKLERTPKWLTDEDHYQIQLKYSTAQYMTLLTGEQYHVDHIIPLQGNAVSGLHVPDNLRVITATDNLRKHNKYGEK